MPEPSNQYPVDMQQIIDTAVRTALAAQSQLLLHTQQRAATPMLYAEPEDDEEFMFTNRNKLPEPKHWDGEDITKFHSFKHKTREFILGSLPYKAASSFKGVRLASTLLEGAAYDWYITETSPYLQDPKGTLCPFPNYDEFIHKMGLEFGIFRQEENARNRLKELTGKPWLGDYHTYFTRFQSIIIWCTTMDELSKKNEFIAPLTKDIKSFAAGHPCPTWKEAHRVISTWLINVGLYTHTKTPAFYHHAASDAGTSSSASTSSSATPMEIGAVPARSSYTPKVSSADFWKDKKCLACGQLGHSKNYRGCPKHKEYKQPVKPARSAAVEPAHHDTQAAPVSYADAVASTPSDTAWKADMEDKLAAVCAALKD